MNKYLQEYFNSFKVKRKYWHTFTIDLAYFIIVGLLFNFFLNYLQRKSVQVMAGKTPEEIQNLLSSGAAEQIAPYLSQIQTFLFISVGGLTLLGLLTFFLFSLSRALVWNHLLGKKLTKNNYWKWNALNLALIIPLLAYSLIFLIVKGAVGGIVNFIINLSPTFYIQQQSLLESVALILNSFVNFFLVLFMILGVFLVYHSFTQKYKVWESIGVGFSLMKKNWKIIWKILLLMILTAIIITSVLWPLKNVLLYQTTLTLILNLVISALFVAWMRIYLLKSIKWN